MRNLLIPLLVAAVAGATVGCAKAERQIVTLAVINARVWTGDSASPWAEAIAVAGERIAAVGTSATIRDGLPASAYRRAGSAVRLGASAR